MTPRQKRQYFEGLGKTAMAPRKSWLGKSILLTDVQSGWIKSLLTVWGECVRGGTAPAKPCGHSCWQVIRGKNWSDKALERFTAALNQAREEGYRGEQAMRRARSILWPEPPSSLIDEAISSDDAEFMEDVVLQAFDLKDPVYIVGRQYYTTRKKYRTSPEICRVWRHGLRITRPESGCAGVWKYSGRRCSCQQRGHWRIIDI